MRCHSVCTVLKTLNPKAKLPYDLIQNSTVGAVCAASEASKGTFFSKPNIPAIMLLGTRRTLTLYSFTALL